MMRSLWLAGFALFALLQVAVAQLPWQSGVGTPITAAAYAGPGDVVASAKAWWGLRAYSAAVAATGTQKSVNIRRASDSTTSDIVILTTGYLDLATAGTFCAATTCFVTKFYDQSGNSKDISQATAGNQPQIFLSGGPAAGYPYVSFTTGSMALSAAANLTPATGVQSHSGVASRAAGTAITVLVRCGGSGNELNTKAAANVWQITGGSAGGSVDKAATDNTWHAANTNLNGASSVINVDGSEATGTATGATGASALGMLGAGSNTLKIVESGCWDNITFTSQNRTDMNTQQHAAWGF
jgi:hypothetical protein